MYDVRISLCTENIVSLVAATTTVPQNQSLVVVTRHMFLLPRKVCIELIVYQVGNAVGKNSSTGVLKD